MDLGSVFNLFASRRLRNRLQFLCGGMSVTVVAPLGSKGLGLRRLAVGGHIAITT